MILKLLDRIKITQILPSEGNIKTIAIVSDILKKVSLKQEDFLKFDVEIKDGYMKWNDLGEKETFDISFTELEKNEVKLALEKRDKEGKITADELSICRHFGVL